MCCKVFGFEALFDVCLRVRVRACVRMFARAPASVHMGFHDVPWRCVITYARLRATAPCAGKWRNACIPTGEASF